VNESQSEIGTQHSKDESAHDSDGEATSKKVVDAETYLDLQENFKSVFNECVKVKRSNLTLISQLKELEVSHKLNVELKSTEEKLTSKLKEIELEINNLLGESQLIKRDFRECMIVRKNLESRVLILENELKEAKCVKMNLGECSNKLDRMLGDIQ